MLSFNNSKCKSVGIWFSQFHDKYDYKDFNGDNVSINYKDNLVIVSLKTKKKTLYYPNPVKIEVSY